MTVSEAHAWAPSTDFWRDRPVAVTGATGFLGSHLTELLVRSHALVVALVRDQVPIGPIARKWDSDVVTVTGDVTDQSVLERLLGEYDVRTVFHLAAQSQVGVANRNPTSTFDANLGGTWALLEAVRRSPLVSEVVVASSDKAYGQQDQLPYTEDMPLAAVNPYDVSKACADLITASYHHTFGVPASVTRCGNLFGPGDTNWQRLIPGTVRSVLRSEQPLIRSDGSMVRDYLYVVDAALAYLRIAEAMAADSRLIGEAFNLSNETPLSVLQVVDLIQKAAGTHLQPEICATAMHEIDQQFLSAAKAQRLLGWQPCYAIEAAIALTVEWYRVHLYGKASGVPTP